MQLASPPVIAATGQSCDPIRRFTVTVTSRRAMSSSVRFDLSDLFHLQHPIQRFDRALDLRVDRES